MIVVRRLHDFTPTRGNARMCECGARYERPCHPHAFLERDDWPGRCVCALPFVSEQHVVVEVP